MTIRLKDSLSPNRARDERQRAELDQEERRREQNMAALAVRCAAVGVTLDAASYASTVAGETVEQWLCQREADAGLIEPEPPAPRWQPRCVDMLGPRLYALAPSACRAVQAWANAEGQRRGVSIEFPEGELASEAGMSGGELLAALAGRSPISEGDLVRLARALGVDAQSIVWRRRSGLQEL